MSQNLASAAVVIGALRVKSLHAGKSRMLIFNFFKKIIGILLECHTVWIQLRPDIVSELIWVQNVFNDQQMTKVITGKELIHFRTARNV